MFKAVLTFEIILDYILLPGWNDDYSNFDTRTNNVQNLHNSVEVGKVELYVLPTTVNDIYSSLINFQLPGIQPNQVIDKILDACKIEFSLNYHLLLKQASSIENHTQKLDLDDLLCLVYAKNIQADYLITADYKARNYYDLIHVNNNFDFQIPILIMEGNNGEDGLANDTINNVMIGHRVHEFINSHAAGNYQLYYSVNGNDIFYEEQKEEIIDGFKNLLILGQEFTNTLPEESETHYLNSDTNNDRLHHGGSEEDIFTNANSNDMIEADSGDDEIWGSNDNDIIEGVPGSDHLAETGDDLIDGGGTEADHIYGENGDDLLMGNTETDHIYGGNGDNIIDAQTGNDFLFGEVGNDMLYRELGSNILIGSPDQDILYGVTSQDVDTFALGSGWDVYIILNSQGGIEMIDLVANINFSDIKFDSLNSFGSSSNKEDKIYLTLCQNYLIQCHNTREQFAFLQDIQLEANQNMQF